MILILVLNVKIYRVCEKIKIFFMLIVSDMFSMLNNYRYYVFIFYF